MIITSVNHPQIHVDIKQISRQKWTNCCYINNILLHGGTAYSTRSLETATKVANNWILSAETVVNSLTQP